MSDSTSEHDDHDAITGDEHPDGIVGPERETPEDAVPDDERTAEDLAASGVNLADPTPEPVGFTVVVVGDQIAVEVDGVNEDDEDEPATDAELEQAAIAVYKARAALAARPVRPFEHVGKENLLVLANQLRAELAYR